MATAEASLSTLVTDLVIADVDEDSREEVILLGKTGTDGGGRLIALGYEFETAGTPRLKRDLDVRYGADDGWALFDSTDPETGYDVLSTRDSPSRTALCWADGTPSGYAIRGIPQASERMTIRIEVPE